MADQDDNKRGTKSTYVTKTVRVESTSFLSSKTKPDIDAHLAKYAKNIKVYQDLKIAIQDLQASYQAQYGRIVTSDIEINKKYIDILDHALASGDWQGGMLFETARKDLQNLRDQMVQELELGDKQVELLDAGEISELAEDEMDVYAGLHLSTGAVLETWETSLRALAKISVGRPIYREEAHVKEYLNTKVNKKRDTYVVVRIKKSNVLIPRNKDYYALDKAGHELLLLREGALKPENILSFVYNNKPCLFKNGHVIKPEDN